MTLTQRISHGFKGWHGVKLNQPDWSDDSHSIALSVHLPKEDSSMFFIYNPYWEPLEFELPPLKSQDNVRWRRWIDTYLDSPQDITEWQKAPVVVDPTYRMGPRSVAVLWANSDDDII
jgi:isoamylase